MPRIYIDACVFIDMATHEANPSANQVSQDVWICQQALKAARDGELSIITSMLSIAECTKIEDDSPVPPDAAKRFYEMLLMSGKSGVTLNGLTQSIAVRARDLRWALGVYLRGADSIHVATALAAKCDEIWTGDKGIWKKREQIRGLGLSVLLPSDSTVLPSKYRTGELFQQGQ